MYRTCTHYSLGLRLYTPPVEKDLEIDNDHNSLLIFRYMYRTRVTHFSTASTVPCTCTWNNSIYQQKYILYSFGDFPVRVVPDEVGAWTPPVEKTLTRVWYSACVLPPYCFSVISQPVPNGGARNLAYLVPSMMYLKLWRTWYHPHVPKTLGGGKCLLYNGYPYVLRRY